MYKNKLLVKICGLRDAANIRKLAALNPDMMGFIFYPPSPRYIPMTQSPESLEIPAHIRKVGVFVDASTEDILHKAKHYKLNALQLHGNEQSPQCRELKELGFLVIKAFLVNEPSDFKALASYENVCDYLLFDNKSPTRGGSGLTFDWAILRHYRGSLPFLLSGGVGPQDARLLQQVQHPKLAGVDLNSRFETSAGIKDKSKLQAFMLELKSSDQLTE